MHLKAIYSSQFDDMIEMIVLILFLSHITQLKNKFRFTLSALYFSDVDPEEKKSVYCMSESYTVTIRQTGNVQFCTCTLYVKVNGDACNVLKQFLC